MHLACHNNYNNVAKSLITVGKATVDIVNNHKQTPLHLACSNGHTDIVKTLLEHGSPVNISNNFGQIPLHYAFFHARSEVINVLLLFNGVNKKTAELCLKNVGVGVGVG
ncbi:MAG: ankyrin repeat domain-containing protein, partial [Endozoicomonadaceae bacterium]|nr:ankyrin repeat domain-containing protein [Endozoicomonadaceae bacterium]